MTVWIILALAAFVLIVSGSSLRRRGGMKPLPPGQRLALMAALIAVAIGGATAIGMLR